MASRQTTNTASSSGYQYAAGTAGSAQIDILLSPNPAVSSALSALGTALIGTTINGSVVGPLEVWSDGVVWDTSNSRILRPGSDYDITLLYRSGF